MSDETRERLLVAIANGDGLAMRTLIANAIIADPSLLVDARPRCERCGGTGTFDHRTEPDEQTGWQVVALGTCSDCGGSGYQPMTALPTKVVEEAQHLLSRYADTRDAALLDDQHRIAEVFKAVRLAQETLR